MQHVSSFALCGSYLNIYGRYQKIYKAVYNMYQTNLTREEQLWESRWMVVKYHYTLESPVMWLLGLTPRVYEWVGLGRSLKICLSDKFLGDTDAAGTHTTLWEALDKTTWCMCS